MYNALPLNHTTSPLREPAYVKQYFLNPPTPNVVLSSSLHAILSPLGHREDSK
jgi:hypothetical protein